MWRRKIPGAVIPHGVRGGIELFHDTLVLEGLIHCIGCFCLFWLAGSEMTDRSPFVISGMRSPSEIQISVQRMEQNPIWRTCR